MKIQRIKRNMTVLARSPVGTGSRIARLKVGDLATPHDPASTDNPRWYMTLAGKVLLSKDDVEDDAKKLENPQ